MEDNFEEMQDQKKFFRDTKNIIIIILSILLVVTIGSSSWISQETSTSLIDKEKTIQANLNVIEDLQKEKNLLIQEKQDLENDNKQLKQEKDNLETDKNKIQQEKQDLETQKSTLELETKNLKNQIEQLKKSSTTKNIYSNTSTQKEQPSTTIYDTNSSIVYVTRTGEKYHKSNCSYLRQSKIEINLSEAKRLGYTPCSRCY